MKQTYPERKEVSAPTGWASPVLARAYADIEKLNDDLAQPTESGISESLVRVLDAIEAADCELEPAPRRIV